MSDLLRMSFTVERRLAEALDALMARSGANNRSEFLRDLIRDRLVREEWQSDQEVVGTITLVYDHHRRGLTECLTALQHDFHDEILASTHVHLDRHICVEAILVKGRASQIRAVADRLQRPKGVLHCSLALATTGTALQDGFRESSPCGHDHGTDHTKD